MPIYLKYGDFEGSVTDDTHKGWIEVNSVQFGVGRGISTPTGNSADREASAPSISEVTCTKVMDKSTFKLMEDAYQGEGLKAQIFFTRTGKAGMEVYAKYTLENSMISGYSVSSGGERPTESLSINFTTIEFEYTDSDDKNTSGSPIKVKYDIGKQKMNP